MRSFSSQDDRKNPNLYPTWTVRSIADIYGYSRKHVRKIVDLGFVSSYNDIFANRVVTLVHTASMNEYVRRQQNRRRAS